MKPDQPNRMSEMLRDQAKMYLRVADALEANAEKMREPAAIIKQQIDTVGEIADIPLDALEMRNMLLSILMSNYEALIGTKAKESHG